MKHITLLSLLALSLIACQDEASLSYCPALQPCLIDEAGEVVVLSENSEEYESNFCGNTIQSIDADNRFGNDFKIGKTAWNYNDD